VVDPARLSAPLRAEPGLPDDPDGMLFPHLYGPLPTSAVVATVPYRPPAPPVLPAPDDELGRAMAFYLSVPVRRASDVRDVRGGVAVVDPDYRWSQDDNRLLLSEPLTADEVEALVGEVAADAGWPHRAAALRWPGAGAVAAELRRRRWQAGELLLMARPAAPLPGGERAEVVDQSEVHAFWDASWRADAIAPPDRLDEVVGQLVGREHRNDLVVAVTDVVVREEGRVVASAQLRVDGATAAVESVLTDPASRGRGHADALLARVVSLAAEAGCDLVVLEADAEDWPHTWYARRGFRVVGSVWDVSRPGATDS
jgi:ribosomal protein S18 acetylase RimI-like enzyme